MYYRHIIKRKKSKTDTITPLLNVVPQVGGGTSGDYPQMTYTKVDYCNGLIFEKYNLTEVPAPCHLLSPRLVTWMIRVRRLKMLK